MKGHNPFQCKREVEISDSKTTTFLEIGSLEQYCNCDSGQCDKDKVNNN